MAKKLADVTEEIGRTVVGGYQKIEDGVVGAYKKVETSAVKGFRKVSDKAVDVLFAKEGETVEDARARLANKK